MNDEWISVSERLPAVGMQCRVKNATQEVDAWFISWKHGYYFSMERDTRQNWEPTHWRPLQEQK
jgi:hypothetical protein